MVTVSPGVIPVTFHENSPCGNETPDGLPTVVTLDTEIELRPVIIPMLEECLVSPVPVAEFAELSVPCDEPKSPVSVGDVSTERLVPFHLALVHLV